MGDDGVVLPAGRAGDQVQPLMVVVPTGPMLGTVRARQRADRWVSVVVCALALIVAMLAAGGVAALVTEGQWLAALAEVCVLVVAAVAAWSSSFGMAGWLGHHHMDNPIDCAGAVVAANDRAMRRMFTERGPVEPVTGDRAYVYARLHHQVVLCEQYVQQLREEMAAMREGAGPVGRGSR